MSRGESTKRRILEVAIKLASNLGVHGITIGKLAKAADMSKSGLFAHFANKDELQLEVLKLTQQNFIKKVLSPSFKEPKGLARVQAMFNNWLLYLNDTETLPGGSLFLSSSFELDTQPGPLRDFLHENQTLLIKNIEKAAMFAVETNEFRKNLNCHEFAKKLYSFVLGYHHYKQMLNDPEADTFIKNAFDQLIDESKNKNINNKKTKKQDTLSA